MDSNFTLKILFNTTKNKIGYYKKLLAICKNKNGVLPA